MIFKKSSWVLISELCWGLLSCDIGAGTHGSIKRYQYPISKYELEEAVMEVIKSSPNIARDTADLSYYNDGTNYVTIEIKNGGRAYKYTFRYYGGEEEWEKSKNKSELFIAYAYDENLQGGSEGNSKLNSELEKKLTETFEEAFVSAVDEKLGITHIPEE